MRPRRARDLHGMRLTVAATAVVVGVLALLCVATLAVATDAGDKPATIEADDYDDIEDDDSGMYEWQLARSLLRFCLRGERAQIHFISRGEHTHTHRHPRSLLLPINTRQVANTLEDPPPPAGAQNAENVQLTQHE